MNEAMQEFVRYAKLFDLKNPDQRPMILCEDGDVNIF